MGIDALIRKWEQECKSLEEKQKKVKDFNLLNLELSICRVHLRELKEAWDNEESNDSECLCSVIDTGYHDNWCPANKKTKLDLTSDESRVK